MSDSKTLVVIGGSSGIGLRTAQVAAAQGAQVIIGGRDRQRLDEALKTLPQNAIARQVDAFSSTSLAAFLKTCPWSTCCSRPAPTTPSPLRPGDRGTGAQPVRGQVLAAVPGRHAALPRLAPDASVLLMSGAASARPVKGGAAYAAANAAIEGLARGWPPSWRRDASTRSRPAP